MRIFRRRLAARATAGTAPDARLTLPYERRCRSRQRVRLDSGEEAGMILPRGTVLCHGDLLIAEDGFTVAVAAAVEPLTVAASDDPLLLVRASYHLGNRHAAVQIGPGELRYLRDPVLDRLLTELGLVLRHEKAPFQPEPGAWHHAAHDH